MLLSPSAFMMVDNSELTPRRKSTSAHSTGSSSSSLAVSMDRAKYQGLCTPSVSTRRKRFGLNRSMSASGALDGERVIHMEELEHLPVLPGAHQAEMRPLDSDSQNSKDMDRGDRTPSDFLSPSASTSTGLGLSSAESSGGASHVYPNVHDLWELEDLKEYSRKIRERESQFVRRRGRKLHRYSAAEVPYPRSYDRDMVDHDVWCMVWAHQLSGELSLQGDPAPPDRVLDIGCGTGSWILNAAVKWKTSHFVGLDIVSLHPDLEQVDSDLASRIAWVQANFLEGLPFRDGEFDLVYARRIARGVPEDKWDPLLEEVARVLKPGGAFQLSEENLFFPGIPHDLPLSKDAPASTPTAELPHGAREQPSILDLLQFSPGPVSSLAASLNGHESPTATSPIESMLERNQGINSQPGNGDATLLSQHDLPVNPRDHSLLEYIYNEMHAARFINLAPLSVISNIMTLHFTMIRNHPPLLCMFPPPPHERSRIPNDARLPAPTKPSHQSPHASTQNPSSVLHSSPGPTLEHETVTQKMRRLDLALSHAEPGAPSPFVSVAQLVAGMQPYVRVDMTRYAALSPRSIFQPNEFQKPDSFAPRHPDQSTSRPRSAGKSGPSPSISTQPAVPEIGQDRLPVNTVRYDLRTLNLQLSLRVAEVLACSEAMWDFVRNAQRQSHLGDDEAAPSYGPRSRFSRNTSKDTTAVPLLSPSMEEQLLSLTRSQFDTLLLYFKLDMQDYMALSAVLQDRLRWDPVPVARTDERKEFDGLCEAWAQYQEDLENGVPFQPSLARPSNSSLSSTRDLQHDAADGGARGARTGPPSLEQSSDAGHTLRRTTGTPAHERLNRTIRTFVGFKAQPAAPGAVPS